METHIKLIGVLLIGLALLHAFFPRRFRWREELSSLSLLSRQIMYIHTLFIALTVFLMGLLCLSAAGELLTTSLGKRVCLGLAIFWGTRLLVQFVGYSSKLWRGKRFETVIHIVFSMTWLYLTIIFTAVWWR